jgi:hypothetical protein
MEDDLKILKVEISQQPMVGSYGAFNFTEPFFWPFPKKITITSIS